MEDDTEYLKLPVEDRCVHKNWKARLHGYEEAKKIFNQIEDEKSPEWNKFLGLMKKMVVDSNAVAQEKGLEAVLVFVENCAAAGKTVGDVMSGLVTKCVAAPKAKTKELAGQIPLMFIEIEKHEIVLEELLKGTEHKNPKIVAGCINIITQAIREFGVKVVNIKPVVKRMTTLVEDRDKTVRDETKALIVEMYRWIGAALSPQLSSLKPVQVSELEVEFSKVKGDKAVPTRYLRSQQAKQAKVAAEAVQADDDGEGDECDDGGGADVDPYELMVAVDILSRLPKDWQEKIEAKKWQERKEVLDGLDHMLQGGPKLENGDYGDLVRALKKMVTKDSNVVVVALAAKCLAGIANGLKKRFQPYSTTCIASMLEKFREKKQTVVAALREAVDAMFVSTTLEAIQEDVLASLENKNPSVKAETAAFLARCFTKSTPLSLNKKLLKVLTAALLKTINEPDPTVRDTSAEALGTAMKVVGEKAITPFLTDIDNLKMSKIKEASDKAELQVKQPKPTVKKPVERPASAKPTAGSTAPKPVKRPASSTVKKPSPATSGTKKVSSSTVTNNAKSKPLEREMSPEEVDEKAEAIFPAELLSGLADSNWQTRLASMEQFHQMLGGLDQGEAPSQLLLRLVNKKPGLKDTNFQVAKLRLEAIKVIAETFPVSVTGMACVVTDVAEKLSDIKTQAVAADTLSALCEATKLDAVATQVLDYAFSQKNPRVQVEVVNWLGRAIQDFGFVIQPKQIMDNVKKGVTAVNPLVRSASISLVGVLSIYMGNQIMAYFDGEKPTLLQLISTECGKHAGESPPSPVRGGKREEQSRRSSVDTVLSTGTEEEVRSPPSPEPQVTKRVDITPHITESLIAEMGDKNWKVRAEAVQKLQNIIAEHKSISVNLGECGPLLAARLVDSNTKIAASALALCQSLALGLGPQSKQCVRFFFPKFLIGMGDSKAWIRSAAISCINTWGEQGCFREFFEGEIVADTLRTGSPTLRSELWAWLAEQLPNIKSVPKEEMVACIPVLLSNLEDRNADVRKNAAEAVLGVMMHAGYGPLYSACDKLKPGSQGPIKIILEKARGSLPEKPTVLKSKSSSSIPEKGKANSKMGPGSTATFTKTKPKPESAGGGKVVGRSKKDEEPETSPLLQLNSLKYQRSIDDQKLKILKWNFTTPREEFVELLKDQMTTAGVSKALMAYMFHADFKYHLRAIDSLIEDLSLNADAQTANLDLILRWLTLRFFDTNPSVLLKGLEYLQALFSILIDNQYNMIDYEASAFLPYLILKIGDPKDTVRINVRALLKQIWSIYPISKLFINLMDGIKSKNARQRTECLEHMGLLMETFGTHVCQPTAAQALKEIAKQISDRDNSVRTAALNCIVAAYFLDGEKVLKMVSQISDKDMSLLEERIKRAAKTRPVASVKPQPAPPRPSVVPARAPTPVYDPEPEEEEPPPPPPVITSTPPVLHEDLITSNSTEDEDTSHAGQPEEHGDQQSYVEECKYDGTNEQPRPVAGPFGLDQAVMESIESQHFTVSQPKLIEFDLDFLKEPIATINPAAKLDTSLTISPLSKMPNSVSLEWHLSHIGMLDIDHALDGMQHIENLLTKDQHQQLQHHEDLLVWQLVRNLEFLNQSNSPEVVNCYKRNLGLMVKFFGNYPAMSCKVKEGTLREAIKILITLLTEKRLEMLDPGTDMFVRVVNSVIISILEKSDHTSIICALIKNLYDTVNAPEVSAHHQELLMKCIWKVIKFIDNWKDDLQYELIFVDIHAFLRDFPTSWWKKQPSDTPLRTIKTIMHTIVKLKGSPIEEVVKNVRGVTPGCELITYVQKLLKHIKVTEEVRVAPSSDNRESKSSRLSKAAHYQLSEIFKKIGNKEDSCEGLRLLYEFKQQHPDADISEYLQKTTPHFQEYIQRGLKKEADRQLGGEPDIKATVEDNDLGLYLQKLRALQAKAGWNNIPAAATRRPTPHSPPPDSEPLPTMQSQLDTSTDSVSADETEVEALRKRLEKVKRSALR